MHYLDYFIIIDVHIPKILQSVIYKHGKTCQTLAKTPWTIREPPLPMYLLASPDDYRVAIFK